MCHNIIFNYGKDISKTCLQYVLLSCKKILKQKKNHISYENHFFGNFKRQIENIRSYNMIFSNNWF